MASYDNQGRLKIVQSGTMPVPAHMIAFGEGIEYDIDPTAQNEFNLSSFDGCKVTQYGAGGNFDLQVSAGYAWVQDRITPTNGMWLVEVAQEQPAVTIAAADGTNPRIDIVALRVNDVGRSDGWASSYDIVVIQGTPTSGATLQNLNGLGTLPNKHLPLSYVLVPAGYSSALINDTHVNDRRYWAYRPGRCIGIATLQVTSAGAGNKMSIWVNSVGGREIDVEADCGQSVVSSGAAGTNLYVKIIDNLSGATYGGSYMSTAGAGYNQHVKPCFRTVTPLTADRVSRFNFVANLNNSAGTPTMYAASNEYGWLTARYL